MRWCIVFLSLTGCTAESTRLAIETQRRVDDVQQTVFDRQHDGLRVLLFRDLVHRVEESGDKLLPEQVEVLNTVWNERDLLEFWALQNERALGLRRVGVDAKRYGDQAMLDLLWKSIDAKLRRAEQTIAAQQGGAAAARAAEGAKPHDEPRLIDPDPPVEPPASQPEGEGNVE